MFLVSLCNNQRALGVQDGSGLFISRCRAHRLHKERAAINVNDRGSTLRPPLQQHVMSINTSNECKCQFIFRLGQRSNHDVRETWKQTHQQRPVAGHADLIWHHFNLKRNGIMDAVLRRVIVAICHRDTVGRTTKSRQSVLQ